MAYISSRKTDANKTPAGDHRHAPRHLAALETGSAPARGKRLVTHRTAAGCAWGRHGRGEKPPPTDFWPKQLFPQQEGCQPGWAGLSPGYSKATEVPLMVEGWVVCSVSLLWFAQGQKRPERVREREAELHLQICSGKSFPAELPTGWWKWRSHEPLTHSPLTTEGLPGSWWAPLLSFWGWSVWEQR